MSSANEHVRRRLRARQLTRRRQSAPPCANVVQHGGYLVRYCEVKGVAPGIRRGSVVSAGTVIAYVGKMYTMSMLHFELYSGPYGAGGLPNRGNPPYQRRKDLMNPTAFLQQLAAHILPLFVTRVDDVPIVRLLFSGLRTDD
jgi:hypothetical protein